MKVIIAIPTYNCEKQITRVLDEIDVELSDRVDEIWVIDNQSTDRTAAVASAYAQSGRLSNLTVKRNDENNSLGGTHKAAFQHAEAQGATHVVVLHGDNQAKSAEVHILLDRIETHPSAQTVLGSRFSRGSTLIGYDWKRIAGNHFLNIVYSLVSGVRLRDLGSGLNVFALRDLDSATYLNFNNSLTFNYEMILDLVKRKIVFSFEPITWTEADQVSNARNWKILAGGLRNLWDWKLGINHAVPTGLRGGRYDWTEVTD